MAGSWQPDPSKRYAERFRDEFGVWTDRVRNADGVPRKDQWSLWARNESQPAVNDDRLSGRAALGCGLALWLLGAPAVLLVASMVGLGRGFSGEEIGVLPTGIIVVGLGIIVFATIALIVNQTTGRPKRQSG